MENGIRIAGSAIESLSAVSFLRQHRVGRFRYRSMLFGLTIGLCLGFAHSQAAPVSSGAPSANKQTRGYVISYFTYAMHRDEDFDKVCPHGWFPNYMEAFVQALPPDERTRLQKPENAAELIKRFDSDGLVGPYGENVCANPMAFSKDNRYPKTTAYSLQGKTARGLNLDGIPGRAGAPGTCKHEKFMSPEGKPGIDNQFFRALGCDRAYRGGTSDGGDNVIFEEEYLLGGSQVQLIEISGITDLRNDQVEVRVYSTQDAPRVGRNQRFVPNQTLRPDSRPQYTNVMHGKIVDGVLTTDPIDSLRLDNKRTNTTGIGVSPVHDRIWRDARFQLTFNKDGSLKGLLGGYQRPEEILSTGRYNASGHARGVGGMCPMQYKAMMALADGYPDPKTGQCTQISTAYDVEAVPAFIVRQNKNKVAESGTSTVASNR